MKPDITLNPETMLKTTIDIAMEAGNILLRFYHDSVQEMTKSTSIDIVTQADKDAEAYIAEALVKAFPWHHIIGEEGSGVGVPRQQAEYLWYVDPIDGTTNFANRVPHFCTSIALTNADDQPLLGVIYDPIKDELFVALPGQGATLNGQPVHVSQRDKLNAALLTSGFPYTRHTDPDNNLPQWRAFILSTRGVRCSGSAALDLCYVACGRYDGYWERTLKPWDALAGMLIVREAGGIVTDYDGGDMPQLGPDGRYVASNGHIHSAMLAMLAESYSQEA